MNNIKRQDGAALFISLILLLLMTIIVIGGAQRSTLELIIGRNVQYSTTALVNAESGITASLADLNTNYDLVNDGFGGVVNGQYTVSKADQDTGVFYNTILIDNPTGNVASLISQGTSIDRALRTVEVKVRINPPAPGFSLDKAILTNGDIVFGGDAELLGSNQDVHSNGDIYRADKIQTTGTISASGEVNGVADGESYSAIIDIQEIDPSMYAEYADYTFDSDGKIYNSDGNLVATNDYQGWSFNGDKWSTWGSSDVLGGLLYFKGDAGNVDIQGNHGSDESPWEISILADGWIDLAGTPIIANYKNPSNPEAVQELLFMAGTDIKINGHASTVLSGVIAAGEQFSLSGTAEIEGTIVAADQSNTDDFITENYMSGTASITNNGGLSLPPVEGSNDLQILSWREMEMGQAEFASLNAAL